MNNVRVAEAIKESPPVKAGEGWHVAEDRRADAAPIFDDLF